MNTFIGGLASIAIFIAAFAVICQILSGLRLFREEGLIRDFAKTTALTTSIGLFYGVFLAFLRNTSNETTNFFDLSGIFGMESVPDYLFITKIFGKLLFDETLLTGFALAFLYTGFFIWFLKRTLCLYFTAESTDRLLWLIFCLPVFILLYLPNGSAFFLAVLMLFIYLYCKRLPQAGAEKRSPAFLQHAWSYYGLFILLLFLNFLWIYQYFIMGGAA